MSSLFSPRPTNRVGDEFDLSMLFQRLLWTPFDLDSISASTMVKVVVKSAQRPESNSRICINISNLETAFYRAGTREFESACMVCYQFKAGIPETKSLRQMKHIPSILTMRTGIQWGRRFATHVDSLTLDVSITVRAITSIGHSKRSTDEAPPVHISMFEIHKRCLREAKCTIGTQPLWTFKFSSVKYS